MEKPVAKFEKTRENISKLGKTLSMWSEKDPLPIDPSTNVEESVEKK